MVYELKQRALLICAVASVASLKKQRNLTQKSKHAVVRLQMCIMTAKEWNTHIKSNTQKKYCLGGHLGTTHFVLKH